MLELFEKEGYEKAETEDYADVYVINTCTVTHMSDRKSRQYIRRMKKKNPNDCSRVILLSFIPLFISIVFEKYCFQKNIGGFFSQVSSALFFICLAAVFITSAIVAVISYKQKGAYYETLKERKPILVACGVVLVIGILLLLCAKFFM